MSYSINRYVCKTDLIVKVMPSHERVNLYQGAVVWLKKRVQGGFLMRIHMSKTTHRDLIVSEYDLNYKMRKLEDEALNAEEIHREFNINVSNGSFLIR